MLGRGLESLIPPQHHNKEPEKEEAEILVPEKPADEMRDKSIDGPIFQIEVDKIEPNPFQPRKFFNEEELRDLATSIGEHGIIQPLVVTKFEKLTESGRDVRYQLIAGERRLRAAKLAGLERVPVIVKSGLEDRAKLELAILENLQRSDLNPIETARAYAKLQDLFGLTQREVAARLGKSRETVANTMRLLSLPSYVQDAVSSGQLSESQGRLLLAVSNQREQQILFNDIVNNNLSVKDLKSRISGQSGPRARGPRMISRPDPELVAISERLEEIFGTKVSLERKGSGGKISIDYYSPEELQGLIDKFFGMESGVSGAPVDGGGYPPTEEFHV